MPTESELQSEIDLSALIAKAARARIKARRAMLDFFCECTGLPGMAKRSLSGICGLASEFGPDRAMGWIELAHRAVGDRGETRIMCYIYGIARNVRSDMEVAER
jgi:hypothetical protein